MIIFQNWLLMAINLLKSGVELHGLAITFIRWWPNDDGVTLWNLGFQPMVIWPTFLIQSNYLKAIKEFEHLLLFLVWDQVYYLDSMGDILSSDERSICQRGKTEITYSLEKANTHCMVDVVTLLIDGLGIQPLQSNATVWGKSAPYGSYLEVYHSRKSLLLLLPGCHHARSPDPTKVHCKILKTFEEKITQYLMKLFYLTRSLGISWFQSWNMFNKLKVGVFCNLLIGNVRSYFAV